jgi:hypothetical protein
VDKRKAASNYFRQLARTIAEFISNRFLVSVLILTLSLCFINTAAAVIVPHESAGWENNVSDWWLNSFRAGADSFGYYSLALYPTRGYTQLKEGENVEWIYGSLEHQYRFLDVTLYKLTGSNYLLGPVWNPLWHGFNDVHWLRATKRKVARLPIVRIDEIQDAHRNESTLYGRPAEKGDELMAFTGEIDTGRYMVNSEGLYELSIFSDNTVTSNNGIIPGLICCGDRFGTDMRSVPEPCSVVLFGLAALGGFVLVRKTV